MNTPIKQHNLKQLAAYQHSLFTTPRLRYLFFELTDRCNLNCMHCGSKCTSNNNTYLDYSIIDKTLQSVARTYNPQNIMICITGGEPLLHPEVFRVVNRAKELEFAVGITSNGTLISEDNAKKLAIAGLDTIAISLDGIGEVHNQFRCSAAAFDAAVAGIRALKKAGIEPQVLTVVHKNNIHQLDEIYEFLQQEDIYSWRLVNIDPIGRAAVNSALLLDGAELKELFEYIRNKRFDNNCKMDVTTGCSHFLTYDYENEVRGFYFQCGAGTMVASVMANGDIGACLDIERRPELIQGNAYTEDFVEVWENRFKVFRKDRAKESRVCGQCQHREICMGDSAHTWDYANNEPYYCVAKLIEEETQ